jgi:hypothetical protein
MRNKLLVLLTIALFTACGLLDSKTPAAELFDCRASALETLLGDREAAVAAARDIYAGKRSLAEIVNGVSPRVEAVQQFIRDLQACEPAAPEPVAPAELSDAGTVAS